MFMSVRNQTSRAPAATFLQILVIPGRSEETNPFLTDVPADKLPVYAAG
jgi:hypothetical protein